MHSKSELTRGFFDALIKMDNNVIFKIAEDIINTSGISLEEVMYESLETLGKEWEAGDASLAQVYMSGVICEKLADKHFPKSNVSNPEDLKIVIAALEDHHVLGKRIVLSVLSSSGIHADDCGVLDVGSMLEVIKNDMPDILMISTLMIGSALKVQQVVQKGKQIKPDLKVVVGGAPFRLDKDLADLVGADAVAYNAFDGVRIVNEYIKTEKLV